MHRHGSRFPLATELPFITNLVDKLSNHSAVIQKLKLPSDLAFLKKGYTSTLGHDDLTAPGRMQLFDHGVQLVLFVILYLSFRVTNTTRTNRFRLKYPDLQVTSILAGLQDRARSFTILYEKLERCQFCFFG